VRTKTEPLKWPINEPAGSTPAPPAMPMNNNLPGVEAPIENLNPDVPEFVPSRVVLENGINHSPEPDEFDDEDLEEFEEQLVPETVKGRLDHLPLATFDIDDGTD
jgi:hypothetical protein